MDEIEISQKNSAGEGTGHNAGSSERVRVCISSVGRDLGIISDLAFLPMAAIFSLKSCTCT